jgi:hypothetical protein
MFSFNPRLVACDLHPDYYSPGLPNGWPEKQEAGWIKVAASPCPYCILHGGTSSGRTGDRRLL